MHIRINKYYTLKMSKGKYINILVLILLTFQKYNKPTDTHCTVMAK